MGFGQSEKPNKQHKLGIGFGYNFNSIMGDSVRPIELELRYRFNDNHTLKLFTPIRLKENKQFLDAPYKNAKTTQHLFGVGLMYDYARYLKNDFYWIIGAGGDYQWMESDNHRNFPAEGGYNRFVKWKIDHKAYCFYPYTGFRYVINNIGFEAYYKIVLGVLNLKEDGSHIDYTSKTNEEAQWSSYDVPLKRKTMLQSDVSIKIFYYF